MAESKFTRKRRALLWKDVRLYGLDFVEWEKAYESAWLMCYAHNKSSIRVHQYMVHSDGFFERTGKARDVYLPRRGNTLELSSWWEDAP